MTLHVFGPAALARAVDALAKLGHLLLHARSIARERRVGGVDLGFENVHHQPQQSVLKPQAGQRQTACIRYISSPQRSQRTLSDGLQVAESFGRSGEGGDMGSDIAGIIAYGRVG